MKASDWPTYKANGDSAILIEFEARISAPINAAVQRLAVAISAAQLPYVMEIVPAYRSLCVHYDALQISYRECVEALKKIDGWRADDAVHSSWLIELPVCYEAPFGPDISRVAAVNQLTVDEVIARHSAVDYRVYMIGFMPGFPYLGGLDQRLATPRLTVPRQSVAAGSVGIAGRQTGVYPSVSPAGWQIIGRTPVKLYDAQRAEPILLRAGDYLRFYPIDGQQFEQIAAADDYRVSKVAYRQGAVCAP